MKLSPRQTTVLRYIVESGHATSKQIWTNAVGRSGRIFGTLDALERRDLIVRIPRGHDLDGFYRYEPTEAGKAAV